MNQPVPRRLREEDLVHLDNWEPDADENDDEEVKMALMKRHAQKQKRQQERRINRKRKKNTVSFKYNIKMAKIPEKKEQWGEWLANMFGPKNGSSIKDLAFVEHVPE